MSRSIAVARPHVPKVVPAFVVEKLEGKVKSPMIQFDKDGKKHDVLVEKDAGYMVSFPAKGHSIRIPDAHELKRMGFDQTIPLVDTARGMSGDDPVGEIDNPIAKYKEK